MSDVFISYATEDRERARSLADGLEQLGWSVWWDRKIVAGQMFDRIIEEALAEAKCVVVLWSKVSITSEATLLKVNDPPRHDVAVRNAGSLQVGEAVERYLGPNDRAPGKVTKLYGQANIPGERGATRSKDRLLFTTQIAGPGDSGAPIVDSKGSVVAMLYGASQVETIGIMIEDIKAGLAEAF